MMTSQKLLKVARKWQKLAAIGRKRITFSRTKWGTESNKGHFAVYTADERRFMIPLDFLNKSLFKELLKMAEEEYGLPTHCPITLPCDAVFMEYVIYLIRRDVSHDLEKMLLKSIPRGRCLESSCSQQGNHHLSVISF